jgi:Protein of unknown function (DUF3443)
VTVHRLLLFAFLVAQELTPQCGGTPAASTAAPASNVQAIVVNAGPTNNYFNGAFTSVTICVPGQTTACQTIDGVLVDTGSSGLRVLSSVLTLSLAQQAGSNGGPIVECAQFLDGFTWGPVQTADVKLAGEQASRVPVQVIDERAFPNIPTSCSSSGTAEDTLDALGANAILGIGLFKQDCGLACAFVGSSNPGFYYSCPASGCQPAAVPLVSQVQNPVALFPTDNNGVVIQLPAVAAGGAVSVTGSLIYGIGTQSNNALGPAKVLTVDAIGNITTVFGGKSYPASFIDSGSNGIYFLDSASSGLPLCPDSSDFYCPASTQSLSTTNIGTNGVSVPALFNVGNADALSSRFFAFSEISGPNPGGFDFGLGFFFGRSVFTAIEGQATPGGAGPYFAY